MKRKRSRRYSNVKKSLVYLRDFGRGYVSVFDMNSLRDAIHTLVNYVDSLEVITSEGARQKAERETESMLLADAAQRKAASQFNLFDERIIEHE